MSSNWTERRVGDFATRKKIINEVGEDLPPLSVTKDRGVLLQSEKYKKRVATDPCKYVVVEDGDFAFDPMSLYYGALGRVRGVGRGLISPDYVSFIVDSTVDPVFLEYKLRSVEMIRVYETVAQAGNQFGKRRRVYWSVLADLPLLLPPLPEQREIAATLKAVDDAIAAGEDVVEQVDLARRALLIRLMECGVSEGSRSKSTPTGAAPSHWEQATISDLATDISYGTSLPLNVDGAGVPVLRIPNVVASAVDTDLKFAQLAEKDLDSLRLVPDDLLVVRTNGNPAYVGRTLLFPKREGDWAFASYLIRVRVDRDRVLPAYLHYALQSPGVRRCLERGIRTSAGNYNLNTQGIRSTPLNLPPLEEQHAIVGALNSVAERVRREIGALEQRRIVKAALADALLGGRLRVRDAA